ncbi:MAG: pyridoxamine 5'-phosphate oxidase family protein [Vicinamibacterales bacterium]
MGKKESGLDAALCAFIDRQHLFFVATAPAGSLGHVNLSPKGLELFRVLGPHEVAYLDVVGSGAETIAHVRENGRITLMFCAFEGAPSILRLYGRGDVIEPQDPTFDLLRARFGDVPGARAIIRVQVDRIADSCGFGVPLFEYRGQRTQLTAWAGRKGDAGLRDYQRQKNAGSIDGLPALRWTDER